MAAEWRSFSITPKLGPNEVQVGSKFGPCRIGWDRDGIRMGSDGAGMGSDYQLLCGACFCDPSAAKGPLSLQILLDMLVFANTHTLLDEMDFCMPL